MTVDQLRYQPIIEIDKDSIHNSTDIIKSQLDKPLSILQLPDNLPLLVHKLENFLLGHQKQTGKFGSSQVSRVFPNVLNLGTGSFI